MIDDYFGLFMWLCMLILAFASFGLGVSLDAEWTADKCKSSHTFILKDEVFTCNLKDMK